jgi:3'(2'), 5'-bisphosphate nucleotidase
MKLNEGDSLKKDMLSLINECVEIIDVTGKEVLKIYQLQELKIKQKLDYSPLTEADTVSNYIINNALKKITPEITIISEENENNYKKNESFFWLVDPIDGTKEFINKNGEFTINIALIKQGLPIVGVISAPALGLLYTGSTESIAKRRDANGIWTEISVNKDPKIATKIIGSKSHINEETKNWITETYPKADFIGIGSSLKFCLIAEGRANVYPRFGRTMEWDTAAGHAILNAAGGCVLCRDGSQFRYGKENYENPHFIAMSVKTV